MKCTFSELRSKEIICTRTGERIGYADDAQLDMESGRIERLIVCGRPRAMGILGYDSDIKISCRDIVTIGEDTVLVSDYERAIGKVNKESGRKIFE